MFNFKAADENATSYSNQENVSEYVVSLPIGFVARKEGGKKKK
jgi:hypothetical protein